MYIVRDMTHDMRDMTHDMRDMTHDMRDMTHDMRDMICITTVVITTMLSHVYSERHDS